MIKSSEKRTLKVVLCWPTVISAFCSTALPIRWDHLPTGSTQRYNFSFCYIIYFFFYKFSFCFLTEWTQLAIRTGRRHPMTCFFTRHLNIEERANIEHWQTPKTSSPFKRLVQNGGEVVLLLNLLSSQTTRPLVWWLLRDRSFTSYFKLSWVAAAYLDEWPMNPE